MAVRMAAWVGTPLWPRLKYLNDCWMDCKEIAVQTFIPGPQRMNPTDSGDPLHFSPSATVRSTFVAQSEVSGQPLDGLP